MLSVDALARLRDYQHDILALLNEVQPLLAHDAPGNRSLLAQLRWRLVRVLRAYQVFKHGEIFNPMMRSGPPAQAAFARDLKAQCVTAGDSFRDYVSRWSTADLAASWDEHVAATGAMIQQLRHHLQSEQAAIGVLLSGAHRTRRPAAHA